MADDTPKINTAAPGTEYIVEAGELYDIIDETGQSLSLKGVESEWTMEFLRAYDAFRQIRTALGRDHEQSQASFLALEEKWETMPLRLVRDMPSFRAGGIIVPGGS